VLGAECWVLVPGGGCRVLVSGAWCSALRRSRRVLRASRPPRGSG